MERIKAQEGYIFKKNDGALLSDTLILGIGDNRENYVEIKKPIHYILIDRYSEEYQPLFIGEEGEETSDDFFVLNDEKICLFDESKSEFISFTIESEFFEVGDKCAKCKHNELYRFTYKDGTLKVGKQNEKRTG